MSSPNPFHQKDVKHGEILHILRNSPKGRLRYDTGWDEKPQAVWHLISTVQAEQEAMQYTILEKAIMTMKRSEENEALRERDGDISPSSTSSGGESRLTLSENGSCGNNRKSVTNDTEESPVSKRKGYGIREDEYDDEAMEREFRNHVSIDQINHVQRLLTQYNKSMLLMAKKNASKVLEKKEQELEEYLSKLDLSLDEPEKVKEKHRKNMLESLKKQKAFIDAEMEAAEIRRMAEQELINKHFDQKKLQLKEEKAKENAAAVVRAAIAKEAEQERQRQEQERQRQEHVAKEAAEKKLAAERLLLESQKEAAEKKLAAEQLLLESQKEPSLPVALQGYILKEDCDKYMNCNNLVQKFEEASKDIVAGSNNPTIKKFYSAASTCINTPLNALANTDPRQISAKTTHFLDLIEGKPVVASSTMTTPFNSSVLPNGKVFVIRLLAFRFVKKAESEILSEKKGFLPLATIAFSVCQKCPEWASLVQAYFYKLCPFLVPFSFPREKLSLQEYCSSLGYDLKGSDATLLTELLGRVKGYCSLYAIIVQTFEKNGQFNFGEATSFFTIGGVWEILTKTMKLNPQPDVTVMVIQTLLEILSDRLMQVYGSQFQKLMHVLISVYLPKINQVSTGASQSGVVRFQTFLEQRFLRR